jgi:hypothetical protein
LEKLAGKYLPLLSRPKEALYEDKKEASKKKGQTENK